MAVTMSGGERNDGLSGSKMDLNGSRASSAAASRSAYSSVCPALAQLLRHAWSNHRPLMFLSSRVVPQTPPSLVKFSSRARGVTTGAETSVPSRDQVPELRNAVLPPAATDAN